jgi:hypothetical protein
MNKRKLTLDRTTLRQLQSNDLAQVQGGADTIVVTINAPTRFCPAPSLPDPTIVQTIGTSGTSVINPSGGSIVRH